MKRILVPLFLCILLAVQGISALSVQRWASAGRGTRLLVNFEFSQDPGLLRPYVTASGVVLLLNDSVVPFSVSNEVTVTGRGMILDIASPVRVYGYRLTQKGRLLNLELYTTPFLAEAESLLPSFRKEEGKAEPVAKADPPKTLFIHRSETPPKDPADHREKKEKWVIVIDPGHGGHSSGAVGPTGYREKDLVLAVSREVKKILDRESRISVVMTRDSDVFKGLGERTALANKIKADLFVSIHANAVWGKARRQVARGVETYFLGEAQTDEDRALAIKENEDIKYESEYADAAILELILSDLTQSLYQKESHNLASLIQNRLITSTGWTDRGVKQNNYYVLRLCYMPAVLVEIGFISHPEEERLLKGKERQRAIALEIADGIKEYIRKHDALYAEE
ncbi:MAG TPA: N-acetylmuramoyl-L-alanine amidase [Candidatus Mcinerneyibacteriales bacterium]|nr:N-acetylmuramoyl-L-alanine amidase [Candidatus Mcinerneyibacteriales bacterium]